MSFSVVLYAEGPGEEGASRALAPSMESPLPDDRLGPAHILVRRILAARLPDGAIRFLPPLPVRKGGRVRRHHGSDLLDTRQLRRLLTFARTTPNLAIVLVDRDGDSDRGTTLRAALENLLVTWVLGVARQEFEAWLIADHAATRASLDLAVDQPSYPERMAPREAKTLLEEWIARTTTVSTELDRRERRNALRRRLAGSCDLEVVARICSTFEEFRRELARVVVS